MGHHLTSAVSSFEVSRLHASGPDTFHHTSQTAPRQPSASFTSARFHGNDSFHTTACLFAHSASEHTARRSTKRSRFPLSAGPASPDRSLPQGQGLGSSAPAHFAGRSRRGELAAWDPFTEPDTAADRAGIGRGWKSAQPGGPPPPASGPSGCYHETGDGNKMTGPTVKWRPDHRGDKER